MNFQIAPIWNQVVFDDYYKHVSSVLDKSLSETTASNRNELNYYRDLCSNLKQENRKLREKIDSLDKELKKKIQEYDELLEEVREC